MLAAANSAVCGVTAEAASQLHGGIDTVFVDIRDVRELEREGMIPGAFHCPRGMLEFWAHPQSPYFKPEFATDKTYLLYCASGWRSALGAKSLLDMGMDNVAHLSGGFSAWREAGGATTDRPKR
ncbi:MAG: rhodanese-like domain-containing protein [Pseudomonadota bacterium]